MDEHGRAEAWEWRERALVAEAERDRLRAAVEDAVVALSATDYDDWTRVLGAMREALDGSPDMGTEAEQ